VDYKHTPVLPVMPADGVPASSAAVTAYALAAVRNGLLLASSEMSSAESSSITYTRTTHALE